MGVRGLSVDHSCGCEHCSVQNAGACHAPPILSCAQHPPERCQCSFAWRDLCRAHIGDMMLMCAPIGFARDWPTHNRRLCVEWKSWWLRWSI